MKTEEFREWLKEQGYQPNVANARVGNCLTVCNYEDDLDSLYAKDKCQDLMNRLCYSTQDERNNAPVRHRIPINGNQRTGSATLKQAVGLYIRFVSNDSIFVKPYQQRTFCNVRLSGDTDWPTWNMPTEEDSYQLAKVTTKYIRFLNPEIIARIVNENEKQSSTYYFKLKSKGIEPELYIWEKNSCCFPGVRRYAGSSEIAAYRKRMEISAIEDALALDDNDYPKQIWSFIFRDKQFSKYGPAGYSLAHLIDHKKDKNRMDEEFIFSENHSFKKPFYGLYTCASNSVYIPNSLMKPTDFNGAIRNLLVRKAESLYGKYCNLVPSYVKTKESYDSKWNIENFEWAEPVGTVENLDDFFMFREKKMNEIFDN